MLLFVSKDKKIVINCYYKNCYCIIYFSLVSKVIINVLLLAINVCVCLCVCVCVCVCVPFHRGFFHLQDVWGILEGTNQRCYVEYHSQCFCQVPSSPYLKTSYFTSNEVTPAYRQTGEKWWYIWHAKRWYIFVKIFLLVCSVFIMQ